jgi:hypothetical protein
MEILMAIRPISMFLNTNYLLLEATVSTKMID